MGVVSLIGYVLDIRSGGAGVWMSVLAAILLVIFVAFVIWVRVIKKRLGSPPPDRPGHETERFHFKYGGDPPGWE